MWGEGEFGEEIDEDEFLEVGGGDGVELKREADGLLVDEERGGGGLVEVGRRFGGGFGLGVVVLFEGGVEQVAGGDGLWFDFLGC